MEVGMGIHGEPGLEHRDVPTADGLAELLVDALLEERPPDGVRAVVLLNGLGSVKYEEMFVLYGNIAARLDVAGVTIVEPEVGELVTSFDMAGVSLTLAWLDDELEQLWAAPCSTPAHSKGAVRSLRLPKGPDEQIVASLGEPQRPELTPGSAESQAIAAEIVVAADVVASMLAEHAEELGRVDAVAGDGDHGIGMQRGSAAAAKAVRELEGAGAGTTLIVAGDAWSDRAGGTSGALWGIALRALGEAIGDETVPSPETIAEGLADARDGIVKFGKAKLGDKTMLDVLIPVVEAAQAGRWDELPDLADEYAQATADLLPKIGRARPHAEKSIGTPDAGALSLALVIRTVVEARA
jgi:dihydroxyacetone kinase